MKSRVQPLVGFLLILVMPALPCFGATISVVAPSLPVQVGQTFTVDVRISDVIDLYAYQFDLSFSPAEIRADGIAEGSFLTVGGTTFFAPGVIDNGVGTIAFTADTLIGSVPGVTGSGVVATIDFTALTIGTSPLALSNVLLLDSGLGDIAFQASTASVTVTDTVIPEPSTALLLACGLIALGISARRRR